MNETKDKKELSSELDSVLSNIQSQDLPEEKEEKKKKLWDPEVVTMLDDEFLTIGQRKYRLVHNHRDCFDAEKLGDRFSEVLSRYDYIVGDWGYDQLRLKGFFNASHKKAPAEQKIDTIEDYLYEYCNFGCAFFVLERIGGNHDKRQDQSDFDDDQPMKPRKKKKKPNRPKNKAYIEEKVEKLPPRKEGRSSKPAFKKKRAADQPQERAQSHTPTQTQAQNQEKKRNFTIRQKD